MKHTTHTKRVTLGLASLSLVALAALPSHAQVTNLGGGVIEYGNENQMGAGPYPTDPKAGVTLTGLAPGAISVGTQSAGHTQFIPQPPAPGTFMNTDQIFVGQGFAPGTGQDGYSMQNGGTTAKKGPAVFTLDFSSLVPVGQTLTSLTLGIGADDFQAKKYGNLFSASINGVANSTITNELNNLTLTDPSDLFFTVGLDPTAFSGTKIVTLSIDEANPGSDGFGVDFLTVGATSAPVPEASTTVSLGLLLALGLGGLVIARRRKASASAI